MSSPPLLVGIDLGTSACKCAVIRSDGALIASSIHPYPISSPHSGWAEQDSADWYAAVSDGLKEISAAAGVSPSGVAAIGLSGQMHTTVCLDRRGQPLRPAILWSDRRASSEVELLNQQVGPGQLRSWTGNRLAAGFTLPTWLWLRKHEPSVYRQAHCLLLPKDAVRFFLTGQLGTDPSDASATMFFDPFHLEWCQPLLTQLGLDSAILPPISPSAALAGGLLPEISRQAGLKAGTPVVYGGSDQSMQALGNGIIRPGQVSSTIGTGGQLFAPLDSPVPDPAGRLHLFCHALPGLWHLEAAILSAGACLQWLRDQIAPGASFTSLADAAAAIPPGAEGLYFLPYLAGERTPYFEPDLRGALIGLSLRHTRAHLVRAVMEGVVFAMRQGLDLIRSLGINPALVTASGAAAGHPLWLQLQADIYGLPVHSRRSVYTAAIGAALLAGIGTGVFSSAASACQAVSESAVVTLPDPGRIAQYQGLFSGYVQLAERGLGLSWNSPGRQPPSS